MKKRLLSIVLCLSLTAMLLPATAFAESVTDSFAKAETTEPIDGSNDFTPEKPEQGETLAANTSDSPAPSVSEPKDTVGITVSVGTRSEDIDVPHTDRTLQKEGYYTYADHTLTLLKNDITVSGSSDRVQLKTANGLKTVTLNDLTLKSAAPFVSGTGSLTLKMRNTVSLTGTGDSAMKCAGDLTIQGNTLKAIGHQSAITGSYHTITFDNTTVEAIGKTKSGIAVNCGAIQVQNNSNVTTQGDIAGLDAQDCTLSIAHSTLTATSDSGNGIVQGRNSQQTGDAFSIVDSAVTATGLNLGILGSGALSIQDSAVTATGTNWEGIYLYASSDGNGETVTPEEAPFSMNTGNTSQAACSLSITGSSIVDASGNTSGVQTYEGNYTGIYVNGLITINLTKGGKVTAAGSSGNHWWFDNGTAGVTAGIQSSSSITCGKKTAIITPEKGFVGPYTYTETATPVSGQTGTTCHTVFVSDPDEHHSATVANVAAFGCQETDETYTVTFNSDGGTSVDSQTVKAGTLASKLEAPTKEGYTFQYWETDAGAEYDFSTPVNKDLTLTAFWTPLAQKSYTVTFDSDGGTVVDSQTVKAGELALQPENPSKDGSIFWCWATGNGEEYDFSTPVNEDLTLTTLWTESNSDPLNDLDLPTDTDLTGIFVDFPAASVTKTGDNTPLALFLAGMSVAGGGMLVMALFHRKKVD